MPRTAPIKVPIVGDDKLSKQIAQAEARVKKFSKGLTSMGRTLTRSVTLPISIAGVASLKFARDFNQGMAKIATLIPGQKKRLAELGKGIQALAIESGVSTGDLIEGTYAAISAWGDAGDTMERLRVVTQASQAGYATTAETLALLSSVTEIYGDNSAKAAEHTTDLAFVTNKLGVKAPFADMAASMGKVVPLARQLNLSQEELFATMAAGAGITGNVAEVTTQMRGLYVQLMKETPEMEEIVRKSNDKLGTSFSTVAELMEEIGFMPFLQLMKDSTKNAKEFQKVLGGRTEGLVLASALLGGRTEKYNEALKDMLTRTGQTKEAYKEVTDGVNAAGHAWNQTKQRMIVFGQNIGNKLLPIMERLFDRLEPWLKKLEGISDESLDAAIQVAALAAAMGPLLTIMGTAMKLTTTMKFGGVISGLGGVGTAAGDASKKVGMLGKGMGLLGAGGALIAAGAFGYTIGTMIHKGLIAPATKKTYEKKLKREDVMGRARIYTKGKGTAEYKTGILEELDPMRTKKVKDARTGEIRTVKYSTKTRKYFSLKEQEAGEAYLKLLKARNEQAEIELGTEFESQWKPPGPGQSRVVEEKKSEFVYRVKFDNVPRGMQVDRPALPAGVPDLGPTMDGI